jgi:hypothetical protein
MEIVQRLLRRLAMVAVGVSFTTSSDVAAVLETIPVRAITDVLGDAEDWDGDERLRLALLLASDRRADVRSGVADSLRERPPTWNAALETVLFRLGGDTSSEVRRACAASLARCLARIPPLERTELIARFALDPSAERREVAALALASCLDVVGARPALEHLLRDPSPAVRRAARLGLAR